MNENKRIINRSVMLHAAKGFRFLAELMELSPEARVGFLLSEAAEVTVRREDGWTYVEVHHDPYISNWLEADLEFVATEEVKTLEEGMTMADAIRAIVSDEALYETALRLADYVKVFMVK